MIAFFDNYVLPEDNGDIALAWGRIMADTPYIVVMTPGKTYTTTQTLVMTRKIVLVGFVTLIMCAFGAFLIEPAAALSVVAGIEARGTNVALREHGWNMKARAILLFCIARKFGAKFIKSKGV